MVKKEVFDWIINKQKNIELRKEKAKKGDEAVLQCKRKIVRRRQPKPLQKKFRINASVPRVEWHSLSRRIYLNAKSFMGSMFLLFIVLFVGRS